ncbi:MAG: hypothetical protein KC492_19880, partial [Myxococcales bacterium]|nr:hypothetical protein [Myxococcales bacterium]
VPEIHSGLSGRSNTSKVRRPRWRGHARAPDARQRASPPEILLDPAIETVRKRESATLARFLL